VREEVYMRDIQKERRKEGKRERERESERKGKMCLSAEKIVWNG
jgi:hypothetical protein